MFFTGLPGRNRTFVVLSRCLLGPDVLSSAAAVSSSSSCNSSWSIGRAVRSAPHDASALGHRDLSFRPRSGSRTPTDGILIRPVRPSWPPVRRAISSSSGHYLDMAGIYHADLEKPIRNRALKAIYPTLQGRCCPARIAPVDTFQKISELRCRDRHGFADWLPPAR